MEKKKVSHAEAYVEDVKKTFSSETSVYARVTAEIDICDNRLMEIIIDNWAFINEGLRHKFARKIYALDLSDTMKQLAKPETSSDEEGFLW